MIKDEVVRITLHPLIYEGNVPTVSALPSEITTYLQCPSHVTPHAVAVVGSKDTALQSAYLECVNAGVHFLTSAMCPHQSDTMLPNLEQLL